MLSVLVPTSMDRFALLHLKDQIPLYCYVNTVAEIGKTATNSTKRIEGKNVHADGQGK